MPGYKKLETELRLLISDTAPTVSWQDGKFVIQKDRPCNKCNGKGSLDTYVPCPECHGSRVR